ncbi:MAG: response regulator, partial [Flavobacteriaceae bacterium]|nr:response regulator [Flavobacteriaceae bacterium]
DEGFEIHTFQSPIEAINKTKDLMPDLVITDYKMPEMDGITMMKETHKIDKNIPFIFLSAYLTKESMQEALKYGIFHFLDKPIIENILVHSVKNAISKRKSLDLAYKAINHILYHYEELTKYLEENNKDILANDLKQNVANLIGQKMLIKDLMKKP